MPLVAKRKRFPLDLRQYAALAVVLVAALATPATAPKKAPDTASTAAPRDNECYRYTRPEKSFVRRMNRERYANNLRPMKLDPEVSKVSRVHTKDMARSNVVAHSTTGQLRRRVTNWRTLGENVGVGSGVDELHRAFMNSETHRANMLDRGFKNIGVGTVQSGGRLWVTVIFEESQNPGTTLSMPSC